MQGKLTFVAKFAGCLAALSALAGSVQAQSEPARSPAEQKVIKYYQQHKAQVDKLAEYIIGSITYLKEKYGKTGATVMEIINTYPVMFFLEYRTQARVVNGKYDNPVLNQLAEIVGLCHQAFYIGKGETAKWDKELKYICNPYIHLDITYQSNFSNFAYQVVYLENEYAKAPKEPLTAQQQEVAALAKDFVTKMQEGKYEQAQKLVNFSLKLNFLKTEPALALIRNAYALVDLKVTSFE
ncbi:hypothetical protein [Psittacicella hinzii]|uniref:Uncharacterized protein n=1 Tax=Psittacicella hinzii TaxID=2028575 RepID=A0A3A1YD48_9GAMM|nr:hypothetical protein [Psittacicella hinzii]RIY35159.1 hypothetical protein CKF58_06990 [Psittacicella hinzii]